MEALVIHVQRVGQVRVDHLANLSGPICQISKKKPGGLKEKGNRVLTWELEPDG